MSFFWDPRRIFHAFTSHTTQSHLVEEPLSEIHRCLREVATYITPEDDDLKIFSAHKAASSFSRSADMDGPETNYAKLIHACDAGDVETVTSVVDADPDCANNINDMRETPLIVACRNTNATVVNVLLNCKGIDANKRDVSGKTALMNGMITGDTEILSVLLTSEKVDSSVSDKYGLTFLWYMFGEDIAKHLSVLTLYVKYATKSIDEWKVLEVDLFKYVAKLQELKRELDWEEVLNGVKYLLSTSNVNHTDLLKVCLTIGNADIILPILQAGTVAIDKNLKDYSYTVLVSINPAIIELVLEYRLIDIKELTIVQTEALMESMIHHNSRDLCEFMSKLVRGIHVNKAVESVLFLQSIYPEILGGVLEGDILDLNVTDPSGNSVFLLLCKYANRGTMVEVLKRTDIDFDIKNDSGQLCLTMALMNHDKCVPKLLWEHGNVQSRLNDVDNYKTSALTYACLNDNEEMVKLIVSYSSDSLYHQDDAGYTALMYVSLRGAHLIHKKLQTVDDYIKAVEMGAITSVIKRYIRSDNPEISATLLDVDPLQLELGDHYGNTTLMCACIGGSDDVVSQFINTQTHILVDAKNTKGFTALSHACLAGNAKTVEILLKANASVNISTEDGITPLKCACYSENATIVAQLLAAKAKVNEKKSQNVWPALLSTCINGNDEIADLLLTAGADINVTELMLCCWYGKVEMVELLLKHKVDVNMTVNLTGATALLLACNNGKVHSASTQSLNTSLGIVPASDDSYAQIVKLLLHYQADVNKCELDGGSPLLIACQTANTKMVQFLLNAKAKVNMGDRNGRTPLFYACIGGKTDIVKLLLKAKADVHLAETKEGGTPLLAACVHGHCDIVEILLQANADVDVVDKLGDTPLRAACQFNNADIVKILVKNNADPNLSNLDEVSPFYQACINGNVAIAEILMSDKGRLEKFDSEGRSPLASACRSANVQIVKLLLRKKAKVNVRDKTGRTPLTFSCLLGKVEIVQTLLKSGADINMADANGGTPLMGACVEGNIEVVKLLLKNKADVNVISARGGTALILACSFSSNMDIVKLLLCANADVNTPNTHMLANACRRGNVELVRLFLKARANVNAVDPKKQTPLMIACENRNLEIVQLLLKYNAELKVTNEQGRTFLGYVCSIPRIPVNIVKVVTSKLTDVNEADIDGTTPLMYARRQGNHDVVQLLSSKKVELPVPGCQKPTKKKGELPIPGSHKPRSTKDELAVSAGHKSISMTQKAESVNQTPVSPKNSKGSSDLISACRHGDTRLATRLIADKAEVNHANAKGVTALMTACRHGNIQLVSLLLRNNADVNMSDSKGCTPLMWSCKKGNSDIVGAIIEAGADLNVRDKQGGTALMRACSFGDQSVVERILEVEGVDVNATAHNGDSAVAFANRYGNAEVLSTLMDKHADMSPLVSWEER